MIDDIEIRRARIDEREEVIRVADTAFSADHRKHDFAVEYPYVWSDERMGDNWVGVIDGRIAGIVGCYPFPVRMGGVEFRAAGIGQVCTLPEYRGRGSMTRLLRTVTTELDGGEYDFAWLWGDRQRYARHGWTTGGQTVHLETFGKYLPEPPDATRIELLDVERDLPRIRDEIDRQPYAVGFTDRELAQLLGCPRLTGATYRADGGPDAWAVYQPSREGPNVLLAGGDEGALAELIAFLAAEAEAAEGDGWKVSIQTGPHDSTLMRVAARHYWRMQVGTAASFRLCDPMGYFSRVATVAARGCVCGDDELSIRNTDNGLEVRLRCEDGRFSVEPRAGKNPVEMSTLELSEAAFGLLPLEVRMPRLAANSPLRALFEFPAHVSHFFAL